ncbi:hypothetical protein GCWU000342_02251 [Shuttleworthella satelles DSM 14600]|uniref:Uncharacterized protein n=1 Tax=Shuttleworthella satelles DSM 14600 TaxID=626523 RepID=C4GDS7_9FIRM|nr:hypothetical protein GCWU000342_02251 [Shuttleworthia satelles DSM 14600]
MIVFIIYEAFLFSILNGELPRLPGRNRLTRLSPLCYIILAMEERLFFMSIFGYFPPEGQELTRQHTLNEIGGRSCAHKNNIGMHRMPETELQHDQG